MEIQVHFVFEFANLSLQFWIW